MPDMMPDPWFRAQSREYPVSMLWGEGSIYRAWTASTAFIDDNETTALVTIYVEPDKIGRSSVTVPLARRGWP